jgi:uracil-DNA glycosylase family 4
MKIKDLNEEIKTCTKCKLSETRMNALCGEGNLNAKLIIIAQAPGETEDKEGKMFIGPSGKVFDELLMMADIDRKGIYLTNLIKCMLPKYRKPKINEIETCAQYLDKELELINPVIISTLGYFTARYIFEKYDIVFELDFPDVFGKVFMAGDKKFVPLQHPTALLFNESLRDEMIEEYRVVKRLLEKE